MYSDEDLLPLSGLQHILFCERQCALIHVEGAWKENAFTAEGRAMHGKAHAGKTESRRKNRTEYGIDLRSLELGLSGKADAITFEENGSVTIVEYKRGRPKRGRMDEVQVCAQAMCLEEMTRKEIPVAALFYGKTKRRTEIPLTGELRTLTAETAHRYHELIENGITPVASYAKKCQRCSLLDLCLPERKKQITNVSDFVEAMTREEQ
jgi:CRISPR-associated exonuclease Cas4